MTSEPYEPIDCDFHDELEAASTVGRRVELILHGDDGLPETLQTRILDLGHARAGEPPGEYMELAGGRRVRFDRILRVDGKTLRSGFRFARIGPKDLPLLGEWLQRRHVAERWGAAPDFEPHMTSDVVFGYLARLDGIPVGYAQAYDAARAGEGWWPNERPGTWGVDLFLADEGMQGQGVGTRLTRAFGEFVAKAHGARELIADPVPDNARAIRCFEKAGFRASGVVRTPDGLAQLLRMSTIVPS